MSEIIDVVDRDGRPTGETVQKHIAHTYGIRHRTMHLFIYNSRREVLLQRRADVKPIQPGMWDVSCGGHIGAGESLEQTVERELAEELGLKAGPGVEFWKNRSGTYFYQDAETGKCYFNNEIYPTFTYRWDGDPAQLDLQEEEVGAARFFTLDDIRDAVMEKHDPPKPPMPLTQTPLYWMEMCSYIENLPEKKLSNNGSNTLISL